MSARLGPEWRALVEAVAAAAFIARESALSADLTTTAESAAWGSVVKACYDLLAADRAGPLVFHRLGCPAGHFTGACTCGEQAALESTTPRPQGSAGGEPSGELAGLSQTATASPAPADPAPEDELDTLLDAYRDGLMSNARATGNGRIVTVEPALERAAIHAEVQRREAAALNRSVP